MGRNSDRRARRQALYLTSFVRMVDPHDQYLDDLEVEGVRLLKWLWQFMPSRRYRRPQAWKGEVKYTMQGGHVKYK